jgi:hypothetical protein
LYDFYDQDTWKLKEVHVQGKVDKESFKKACRLRHGKNPFQIMTTYMRLKKKIHETGPQESPKVQEVLTVQKCNWNEEGASIWTIGLY